MKIACVSDLHGHLPEIPDCDLLLVGGDLAPDLNWRDQLSWMNGRFRKWVLDLERRKIRVVAIAGNHDFWAQMLSSGLNKEGYIYLQDEYCTIDNIIIWGSPWVLPIGNWAFLKDEGRLSHLYDGVKATDILLIHGPPNEIGDDLYGEPLGSYALRDLVLRIEPKLLVCGHIHEGYGTYQLGKTIVINGALMSPMYRPTNPIQVVEI